MDDQPAPRAAGVDRREAIRRVSALLGGVALVGGSSLLAACEREATRRTAAGAPDGTTAIGGFSPADIAFLDDVADTILPDTPLAPGARAAATGAFMARMVTDAYAPAQREAFRAGMRELDARAQRAHGAPFSRCTAAQRLALLETADREQHAERERRRAEGRAKAAERLASYGRRGGGLGADVRGAPPQADAYLPDQRQEAAGTAKAASAAAATTPATTPATAPPDAPHWFGPMKELALLGYFTSEIGCTKAQRYEETPGRFVPCAPYRPGDRAWAGHA